MFNCDSCAALPKLQDLQGCFVPAKRPWKVYDIEFTRCPVTYQTARAVRLVRIFRDGLLAASYETKTHAPHKRMEAMHHIEFLLKLKEARTND